MMPAVWNVAESLELEYRQPIRQSSDQSNSGRKEIEKPPCGGEVECRGQGRITNQADSLRFNPIEKSIARYESNIPSRDE